MDRPGPAGRERSRYRALELCIGSLESLAEFHFIPARREPPQGLTKCLPGKERILQSHKLDNPQTW